VFEWLFFHKKGRKNKITRVRQESGKNTRFFVGLECVFETSIAVFSFRDIHANTKQM